MGVQTETPPTSFPKYVLIDHRIKGRGKMLLFGQNCLFLEKNLQLKTLNRIIHGNFKDFSTKSKTKSCSYFFV